MHDDEELSDSEREIAAMVRTVGSERIDWMAPPAGLWSRIEADISPRASDSTTPRAAGPATEASDQGMPTTAPRRVPRRTLIAALGGGIAAGIALGALGRGVFDPDAGQTVLTADLRTLTTDQLLGQAVLRQQNDDLFLQILANEPIEFAAGIVEVWLIHADGRRMVSIGVYEGVASARFPVPQTLLDQGFRLVDLSREPLDGDNNHSGNSIVRGELR